MGENMAEVGEVGKGRGLGTGDGGTETLNLFSNSTWVRSDTTSREMNKVRPLPTKCVLNDFPFYLKAKQLKKIAPFISHSLHYPTPSTYATLLAHDQVLFSLRVL